MTSPRQSTLTEQALRARLGEIESVLMSDPELADNRAAALLDESPGQPVALTYRGVARRLLNQPETAVEILEPLCAAWPDAPFPRLQLGLAHREAGNAEAAETAMRAAVRIKPDYGDAWLALADLLAASGKSDEANTAFCRYVPLAASNPVLRDAGTALAQRRGADADNLLRGHLRAQPNDVVALCMLADVMEQSGQIAEAGNLLARCLELAPDYTRARHNHTVVLLRQNQTEAALSETERLLAEAPGDREIRKLRAAILVRMQEYDEAITLCQDLLAENTNEPAVWTSLGHMLKSVGRRDEAVEAYREAMARAPGFGEPCWSLVNLKNYELADSDLESMRMQLNSGTLQESDRIHFNFAIGRALEDRRDYEHSFQHYAEGNRLRLASKPYDPAPMAEHVRRCRELFTADFFEQRRGLGSLSPAPIFVIGLPRSGSTLVEQILASHSRVEGTAELPYIPAIASSLEQSGEADHSERYTDVLARMSGDELVRLGDTYLERAHKHRKLLRPHFVDKMPNNFAHAGFIHLILPNARIIDVRRHPLACGLSLFKEHFAGAQNFSYSLAYIGQYYRNYIELMREFDVVLPGRIHRVFYESLVDDTETEVRRLLDYCGLTFEESCLRFYENQRPVNTASSEQVRQPIYKGGIDHWRHFEPWLGPLKEGLGEALRTWKPAD